MKKNTHWFAAITAFAIGFSIPLICTAQSQKPSIKITKYKQGLLNFDENSNPSIYQEGGTFKYKESGTCNVGGEMKPCMWHGFSFHFESTQLNPLINCISVSSSPREMVNPAAKSGKEVKEARWSFVIPGKSGYYIRPQYTILKPATGTFSDTSTCYHEGVEVFKINMVFLQP